MTLTTATNASILLNANLIFISILSVAFLHEKLKLSNGLGITLALAGMIAVMSDRGFSHVAFSSSTLFRGSLDRQVCSMLGDLHRSEQVGPSKI
ncbi:EamA family transporter [Candidatus Bathyarchaeota archaeon]|nr:EamA family transporter [Candidatus Bathyarchaeota archaeon]